MVLIVHMLWNDGYAPNSVFEIPTKVELFFFFKQGTIYCRVLQRTIKSSSKRRNWIKKKCFRGLEWPCIHVECTLSSICTLLLFYKAEFYDVLPLKVPPIGTNRRTFGDGRFSRNVPKSSRAQLVLKLHMFWWLFPKFKTISQTWEEKKKKSSSVQTMQSKCL